MPSKRKMIEMFDELTDDERREIFDMYCSCGRKHEKGKKIIISHCCIHQDWEK